MLMPDKRRIRKLLKDAGAEFKLKDGADGKPKRGWWLGTTFLSEDFSEAWHALVERRSSIERFRGLLRTLAEINLNPRLLPKLGVSDVVQDTLLKAYKHFDTFEGKTDEELIAWLKKILHNHISNVRKSFQTKKQDIDREVSLDRSVKDSAFKLSIAISTRDPAPDAQMMVQESIERMLIALSLLPDDQRTTVVMHYIHESSKSEIAQHLGRTETAVVGLILRGVKNLKKKLAGED